MPCSRARLRLPVTLLVAFAGLASLPAGCKTEDVVRERKCGDKIVERCHWNRGAQIYDRCEYIPMDAGMGTCTDGGVGVDAGAPPP